MTRQTLTSTIERVRRIAILCASLLLLIIPIGCSQNSVSVGGPQELTTSALPAKQIDLDYITAYSNIARGIRTCWLADKKPLQNSQFFTRTNNRQSAKTALISVHAPAEHPKRGPRIFSVHLKKRADGSELRINNRLLDPINNKHLVSDIHQWAKGESNCPEHRNSNEITPASLARRDALRELNIPLPKRK